MTTGINKVCVLGRRKRGGGGGGGGYHEDI